MVLFGIAWHCRVLFGITWYCLVFYGIARLYQIYHYQLRQELFICYKFAAVQLIEIFNWSSTIVMLVYLGALSLLRLRA